MNPLFEKSILTLELPQVLEQIALRAVSDGAKDYVRAIKPFQYIDDIRDHMQEITDALQLMHTRSAPGFTGLRDLRAQLRRAEAGGVLSPLDLLLIVSLLRCARSVAQYGDPSERRDGLKTCLDSRFTAIRTNKYLEDRINNAVISEEEIADSASTELASIRRQIRLANARVREVLHRIVTSQTYSRALQESIITQRGGRFVVPVKAEYRQDVRGLVHDVSASGATLFVEPEQVVEANNELRLLDAKEKKEIERILSELSNEVAEFAGGIEDDIHNMTYLDAVFAKAQYALQADCYAPHLSDELIIDLKKARHPLLDKDKAVPINISIGRDFDTLVITGPNTGGKTVALKTLGLLTIMAQCGLLIPAGEDSEMSLFTSVFADIGDEQSISQSLSTFSSHMSNIVGILDQLDSRSLVLFDELGAGTDPTEGAALAMAIIEHVRSQGARVAATTHYAELKMFALTQQGVENAACEFDIETLRPTYRLLIGVPGKSNAFAISRRLGLDERVIESARQQLSGENIKFEDVITDLEAKRQNMERELAAAARSRLEAEKLSREVRAKELANERESLKLLDKARQDAQKLIADAKRASDATFDELAALKKRAAAEQFAIDVNAARLDTNKRLNQVGLSPSDSPKSPDRPQRPLKPGDIVSIGATGTRAEVISEPDKNGNVSLQAGIMVITAKADGLRLLDEETKKNKVKFTPSPSPAAGITRNLNVKLDCDLRGMASDEAMIELERFIDASQLAHLEQVTIIHGKGTGVLKAAVQKYLKNDKRVASFRPGKYGEGDLGVTVAQLK